VAAGDALFYSRGEHLRDLLDRLVPSDHFQNFTAELNKALNRLLLGNVAQRNDRACRLAIDMQRTGRPLDREWLAFGAAQGALSVKNGSRWAEYVFGRDGFRRLFIRAK